ncbi:MAG TPA: imidazoleglycerol-phosphate dehydratase, partial [Gemmatimonadaceae bacterium]
MTTVRRQTRETTVCVELTAKEGAIAIATTIPFLDHMLLTVARYARVGLRVDASGDLPHHVSEDVAIALGAAVAASRLPTAARFGERTVAMDDALVQCVLDAGGRSYYRGPLPSVRYDHWMRSFAEHARATLHVRVLRGRDRHHVVEAA